MNSTDMLTVAFVRRQTYEWAMEMESLGIVVSASDIHKHMEQLIKQYTSHNSSS